MDHSGFLEESLHSVKLEGVVKMEEEVKEELEDFSSQGLHHIKEEEELDLGVEFGETEDGDSLQSEGKRPLDEKLPGPCLSALPSATPDKLAVHPDLKRHSEEKSITVPCLELLSKSEGVEMCQSTVEEVSTSSGLKKYRRGTDTASFTSRRYACDVCQARFSYSSNLKTHQIIHTKEKPYACDVCQARFNRLGNLKKHQIIHTKEKPYTCDVCTAKFTQFGSLKRHLRLHTKEKTYTCDVCHARFTLSSHLKKHQRIHTKEKSYTCDVCHARFTSSGYLKRHKRIHTKEKPLTFDVCLARFSLFRDFKIYRRTHSH